MFALFSILAAALGDAQQLDVDIRGNTQCPTPAAVATALEPLAPRTPVSPQVQMALLVDGDGVVLVRLFGPGLTLQHERRLPASPSCDERARAAAVVIASWLTPLPPAPEPAIRLAGGEDPTQIRSATGPVTAAGARFSVQGAAALLLSLTPDSAAPGGLVEVSLRPRTRPWVLSIGAVLQGQHQKSVGVGQGAWRRWGGTVGGGWGWNSGRAWLEAHAALLLTRLDIQGLGFTTNRDGTAFDAGASVSLRAGVTRGWTSPWVGAWMLGWAGTQRLEVTGQPASGEVPRIEALVGVGASFGGRSETF